MYSMFNQNLSYMDPIEKRKYFPSIFKIFIKVVITKHSIRSGILKLHIYSILSRTTFLPNFVLLAKGVLLPNNEENYVVKI